MMAGRAALAGMTPGCPRAGAALTKLEREREVSELKLKGSYAAQEVERLQQQLQVSISTCNGPFGRPLFDWDVPMSHIYSCP
jgi:hypothetical protein